MTILRWLIGLFTGFLAVGSVVSFAINILADIPIWLKRSRSMGRLAWATALFWFNIEVWGRVVYVLVNWSR